MAVRALIAEDERLIALGLRCRLESEGYQVVGIAGSGIEALHLARCADPQVVLMDVRMPQMNGIEATRSLMDTNPACVVIVSGSREPEQIARAEQAGAMDYVVKPFEANQMRLILDRAQRRYTRYLAIRDQSRDIADSLETWLSVRCAVKALMTNEGLSEDDAFCELESRAVEGGVTLREAAEHLTV